MSLRAATLDDLDAIMALEEASFPTDAWARETMRQELASEHTRYFVLEGDAADDLLAGYAGLRALRGAADADVQTITIAERRRGRGEGRLLLRALLAEAVAAGAREVFLDVREDNAPARSLYRSEGFEEIGRRPRYYQPDDVDAVVMRLQLTAAVKEMLA